MPPSRRTIFLSRMLVLFLGIVAYLVSLSFAYSTTIFEKAMYAYTIYGAAITPCLAAALFWKRATAAGAIASIVGGTVTTLTWSSLNFGHSGSFKWLAELDAVLPAITVSVLGLIVGSLLTQRKSASPAAYSLRSPTCE